MSSPQDPVDNPKWELAGAIASLLLLAIMARAQRECLLTVRFRANLVQHRRKFQP